MPAGRAPSAGPWAAGRGVSGRLQGRGGGAAHFVAEEAREAALGGGGTRRRGAREAAHVPETQRAVVRGRVEHLAVHLRARGVGGAGGGAPPPSDPAPPRSYGVT